MARQRDEGTPAAFVSAHTPGRWLVYKGPMNMDGGLNPFFRGIVALLKHSGEDDDICVILDRNESAADYEANARLIAAAPDMLDALKSLYRVVAELVVSDSTHHEIADKTAQAGLKAFGAITKATRP